VSRYPTEEELREIREFPVEDRIDAVGLLEMVQRLWHWPSYFWTTDSGMGETRYHLSTGGKRST
jgi:hypothetical protein